MRAFLKLNSCFVVFTLLFTLAFLAPSPHAPSSSAAALQPSASIANNPLQVIPPLGSAEPPNKYAGSFGEYQLPYYDEPTHLNFPGGLAVDGDRVWIAEYIGKRALLYNWDTTFVKKINRPMMYLEYVLAEIDRLCDVAVAPDHNLWLNFQGSLVKADPDGAYLGTISGGPARSYDCKGLAVDGAGNLYVSDTSFHIITIYDNNGHFITSIGSPGGGAGELEFSTPVNMAVHDGALYVAEAGNNRIQIINVQNLQDITFSAFIQGIPDSFNQPSGVNADANRIFVADSGNHRVLIFDRATRAYQGTLGSAAQGPGIDQWNKPYDIAVDSSGRIYISDMNNHRVKQYDAGLVFQYMYGETGVAYLTDGFHYVYPTAVQADHQGNVYVSEAKAHRVVKLAPDGTPLFSLGVAGIPGSDALHFNFPTGLGVDSSNNLYVADSGNHRIVKFSSSGVYLDAFGSQGSGTSEFNRPSGVTIAPDGDIYVVDSDNQRVQVFESNWTYFTTIGITGESGGDQERLNNPYDAAVDSNGIIYISDQQASRLQKCTLTGTQYTCTTLVGEANVKGDPYFHFQNIHGVAVDANDLVYMVDHGMCLIYIYDSAGKFYGTFGEGYLLPKDITFASDGTAYIADSMNQRVQKYSPLDRGYTQVSVEAFGDPNLFGSPLLVPYTDHLYAVYPHNQGGQVWRVDAAGTWVLVAAGGIDDPSNMIFSSGVVFNNNLYLGTQNRLGEQPQTGGRIYRYNGTAWEKVASGGLGNTNQYAFSSMVEFNNSLYAGTHCSSTPSCGAQIWRSSSGNLDSWEKALDFTTLGRANNTQILNLVVHNNRLFASVRNSQSGIEIWSSNNGTSWQSVAANGLTYGTSMNNPSMEVFGGYLYLGTGIAGQAAQIWRCQACASQEDFELVMQNGFNLKDSDRDGYVDNARVFDLVNYKGSLYALTQNQADGVETWRSTDGVSWAQFNPYGLSPNSLAIGAVFNDTLYVGGNNTTVWKIQDPVTGSVSSRPVGINGDSAVSGAVSPSAFQRPAVHSFTRHGTANADLYFTPADFGVHAVDADGDPLLRVMITGLPAHGALKFNGHPVTLYQVIPYDQLKNLFYQPAAGFTGADSFAWAASDGIFYASPAVVTLSIQADSDGDGVGDILETGAPSLLPEGLTGDGNGDGILDAGQTSVTSLTFTPSIAARVQSMPSRSTALASATASNYATFEVSEPLAFAEVFPMPYPAENPPLPNADLFSLGFFEIYIKDITPGAAVEVILYVNSSSLPDRLLAFGAESDEVKFHWLDFAYNGQTGAQVEKQTNNKLKYTLHFVDGQTGDHDLTANGLIKAVFGAASDWDLVYLPVIQR